MTSTCQGCGVPLTADQLACPACRQLVHREELKLLAAKAETATSDGNLAAARDAWRSALPLLPRETTQHRDIEERVRELDAHLETNREEPSKMGWKGLAVLGPALAFLLTKGKLLLLGLANLTTFYSMLAFFGVYWSLFGWKFALGLVLSLYIHEMGHVAEIRRLGMMATAPMFVPGLGAFIQLRQKWLNVAQDARIGLAGPLWGTAAALACWVVWFVSRQGIWLAVGATGAWINLFNLLPIWNLDGGRGFRALTRGERGVILAILLFAWLFTFQGLLLVLAAGSVYRLFTKDFPQQRDPVVLAQFASLVICLTILSANAKNP